MSYPGWEKDLLAEEAKVKAFRTAWIGPDSPGGNYLPWDDAGEPTRAFWRKQYRRIRDHFEETA